MKTWPLLLRSSQPRFQRWRLSRCVPGNGLLQWVGGEVWWSKGSQVAGRLACWMCHTVYQSHREKQISLCPVISPGPCVSSSHPVVWELFFHSSLCISDSVWPCRSQLLHGFHKRRGEDEWASKTCFHPLVPESLKSYQICASSFLFVLALNFFTRKMEIGRCHKSSVRLRQLG